MPKFDVMITRTHTIEYSCEIEVTAKDEESAIDKATEQVEAAELSDKLADFDWEECNENDEFEYEANEGE